MAGEKLECALSCCIDVLLEESCPSAVLFGYHMQDCECKCTHNAGKSAGYVLDTLALGWFMGLVYC